MEFELEQLDERVALVAEEAALYYEGRELAES